jgi:hypothetical protein
MIGCRQAVRMDTDGLLNLFEPYFGAHNNVLGSRTRRMNTVVIAHTPITTLPMA